MKISENYILREIAGEYIVVPTGSAAMDFKGLITLNDTGVFLWKLLQEDDQTKESLLDALCEEYEAVREEAKADIEEFLQRIRSEGMLIE
ncbi:MAG TPA: PqqD family protein [Candidatus Mediterraneibacter caccavium]|jgi:hypothetical protein|uniref:PqqD family protein n=1 Tax=Candidatus Mediterraneibacter caccavium TaxID=2838661 RepID=A0A9D2ATE7_9FIRM|nr:PqqD family protein [Lachnoclostridium sp. An76]OUN35235.1 PqqD family protein [Lachnoclostridium sp. An76]HIX49253.1 PqqD family protein [Candidatus Mediterraneibacter caccavium]